MGTCLSKNEFRTRYFHQGYIAEPNERKDLTEFYTVIFVTNKKRRMARRISKCILESAIFDYLMLIRKYTYESPNMPPYLLKVYNLYCDGNDVFVVTEECAEGCILDVLKGKEDVSEMQLSEWIYQLLVALRFLELCRINHNNVNGHCVFFKDKKREQIRLSLLCTHDKYDNIDENGDLYGLFYIRSPDEIKDTSFIKNGSWYIGVLLFCLLFGYFPFQNIDIFKTYYEIVTKNVTFSLLKYRHQLNPTIYDFLSKCLEKDVRKRFSLEELLAHPWIAERKKNSLKNIISEEARRMAAIKIFAFEKKMFDLVGDGE